MNAKRHFSFFKNNIKSSRQNARVSNQKEIKNHSENEAGMETQKVLKDREPAVDNIVHNHLFLF